MNSETTPHDAAEDPTVNLPLANSMACDPPLQRRTFLSLLGGTGLAGAVLSKLPADEGSQGGVKPCALDQLSHSTFSSLVGSTFKLEAADGQIAETELIEARELSGSKLGPSARVPFSLTFRVPKSGYLPQRIYGMTHPELGQLALFMVPIRHQGEELLLEAIFT